MEAIEVEGSESIEVIAQFDGAIHPVHVRVAGDDDAIYVDLVNDDWRVVEVTAAGWRIVSNPPVKFRRARGMLPLPTPTEGGSVSQLRDFVNIESDEQWALLVAWLVAALRASGLRVLGHSPELKKLEGTPSLAHPALTQKKRAP